ncbi:hypothetical protein WN943_029352 [Citrus x changshan-huyou]
MVLLLTTCTSASHGGPNGMTALHAAAKEQIKTDVESCRMFTTLLENKKSLIKETDQYGWTPIHTLYIIEITGISSLGSHVEWRFTVVICRIWIVRALFRQNFHHVDVAMTHCLVQCCVLLIICHPNHLPVSSNPALWLSISMLSYFCCLNENAHYIRMAEFCRNAEWICAVKKLRISSLVTSFLKGSASPAAAALNKFG